MKILGVLLMLAGIAALVYGGFSYTTHKKAVDVGPIQVNHTKHHNVPVPPLMGIACLAGGGLMLYFGAKGGR